MKFLEGDIVKTQVDKEGFRRGQKGLIIHIYDGQNACLCEVWNDKNYPIGLVSYKFDELELIERDDN